MCEANRTAITRPQRTLCLMLPNLVRLQERGLELLRSRRIVRAFNEVSEFTRVTARHENESIIVANELGVHRLQDLDVTARERREAPFAAGMAPLGLVQLPTSSDVGDELGFVDSWVLDANRFDFSV